MLPNNFLGPREHSLQSKKLTLPFQCKSKLELLSSLQKEEQKKVCNIHTLYVLLTLKFWIIINNCNLSFVKLTIYKKRKNGLIGQLPNSGSLHFH